MVKKKLPLVNGSYCARNEQYGAKNTCVYCKWGIAKTITPKKSVLPMILQEATGKASNLIKFLVARLYGSIEPLNFTDIFKNLRTTIQQSRE